MKEQVHLRLTYKAAIKDTKEFQLDMSSREQKIVSLKASIANHKSEREALVISYRYSYTPCVQQVTNSQSLTGKEQDLVKEIDSLKEHL